SHSAPSSSSWSDANELVVRQAHHERLGTLVLSLSKDERTDMWSGTPLFPERASTMAGRVDNLYFFLLGVAVFFSLLIAGLIVYYAIKYRRRSPNDIGANIHGSLLLEIGWSGIPLLITM